MRAILYIGGVWIRQPKELYIKHLLDLLLMEASSGVGVRETEASMGHRRTSSD